MQASREITTALCNWFAGISIWYSVSAGTCLVVRTMRWTRPKTPSSSRSSA